MVQKMQLYCGRDKPIFPWRDFRRGGMVLSFLVVTCGCTERPSTIDPPPNRPFAGVNLTVAVAEPGDRALLQRLTRSWVTRSVHK